MLTGRSIFPLKVRLIHSNSGKVMVLPLARHSFKSFTGFSIGHLPRELTNVNGTLYFCGREGTGNYQLWKSDGTKREPSWLAALASFRLG